MSDKIDVNKSNEANVVKDKKSNELDNTLEVTFVEIKIPEFIKPVLKNYLIFYEITGFYKGPGGLDPDYKKKKEEKETKEEKKKEEEETKEKKKVGLIDKLKNIYKNERDEMKTKKEEETKEETKEEETKKEETKEEGKKKREKKKRNKKEL
ncbi:658_t:CDS:1 [Racocetra persica]|uniref:658_t:CDS:1 n=1 Tax=Racocetra persica TaxID=160502 RepID=A0ACA9RZK7_9GLOM|nr:658_t:CDS:1 [Racocetra persica]